MPTSYTTPSFTLSAQPAAELDADLIVLPVFENDPLSDEPDLDRLAGGEIAAGKARGEIAGRLYDVFVTTLTRSGRSAARIALVGAGDRRRFEPDHLRRIAIVGGLTARQRRLTRVAVVCRPGTVPPERAAQVIAEGVCLANFEAASYKTEGPGCVFLEAAVVRVPGSAPDAQAALDRGAVLGECTNRARELANEPGNRLTPRLFADRAALVGKAAGLQVDVLDENRIAELRMGLLRGVAQGSSEPPRIVVLTHTPAGASAEPLLALVGKGITFDTGGISIKPAENMDKMKDDMSGGAAVIAAMEAIARLRVPVRCIGVVPMTENMPGGKAVKPGDVLTSAEGKTVEVLNTDAEGRLVLGDAIWYARRLGATHLVDVATLTGACVVALGKSTSGLFGTPPAFVEEVRRASDRAGDRTWPMPVFDDYKDQLKSEIADFTNTGGRAGGAITAALFIKEFTGNLPWAHIDIAGPAWAEEAKPYQPKGPTGVGVRTLIELALDAGGWGKLKTDA